ALNTPQFASSTWYRRTCSIEEGSQNCARVLSTACVQCTQLRWRVSVVLPSSSNSLRRLRMFSNTKLIRLGLVFFATNEKNPDRLFFNNPALSANSVLSASLMGRYLDRSLIRL